MNEQSPLNEGSKGSSSPRKRGRKLAADVINRMVNAHRRRKRKRRCRNSGQRQPTGKDYNDRKCRTESILNLIVHELDTEISSFAIEETEPLWDDEEEVNLMAVWFSRGDNKFHVVVDPTGSIKSFSKNIPRLLIGEVHNCITALIHELYELATETESEVSEKSS